MNCCCCCLYRSTLVEEVFIRNSQEIPCILAGLFVYECTCISACTHVCLCVCLSVCVFVCVCLCVYVHMCACAHSCPLVLDDVNNHLSRLLCKTQHCKLNVVIVVLLDKL